MSHYDRGKTRSIPSLSELWDSIGRIWCVVREIKENMGTPVVGSTDYGQISLAAFRALETFAKNSFILTDPQLEGLFVYDATSTASDDGITTIVKNDKRYIRKDWSTKPYFKPVAGTQLTVDRYLKTGTTYYGMISQYTGDQITVEEATLKIDSDSAITNADVDNIVYFKFADGKYGIRNWKNSIIRPEEFGAKADAFIVGNTLTGTDSTQAFQKTFDSAPLKGIAIELSAGSYAVSDTIKPKLIDNATTYKINFYGQGEGVTFIKGFGDDLTGKNLLEFEPISGSVSAKKDSNIRVHGIEFHAGPAKRCVSANKVIFFKLHQCALRGGEEMCLKVGDDTGDNYLAHISENYFNTVTVNGGQNSAIMEVNAYYAKITDNVSDGGFYALKTNLVGSLISGNTFEGFKYAGVYSKSEGGGGSIITNNDFRPYSHYDPNGLFTGEMHGVYIESVQGGVANNTIANNNFFIPAPEDLDVVANYSIASGLQPQPSDDTFKIVGTMSGATGRLVGWNQIAKTLQIEPLTGTFVNESIIQGSTGGTAVISSIVENHTYCMSLMGSAGSNTVVGNRVEGGEWNMQIESKDNNIVVNKFNGVKNGLLIKNNTHVVGNSISLTGEGEHIAAKRVGLPVVKFEANSYLGSVLENVDLSVTIFGNNTATNFVSDSAVDSLTAGLIITAGGKKRWALERVSPEVGGNAGSNLELTRYNDNGDFVDTILRVNRESGSFIFFDSPTSLEEPIDPSHLTRKSYVDSRKAAASPNTAANAPASYSQAYMQSVLDEFRALKSNMRDGNILDS